MTLPLFDKPKPTPRQVHCEGCGLEAQAPVIASAPYDWHACGVSEKHPEQRTAFWCPLCYPTSPHMKRTT